MIQSCTLELAIRHRQSQKKREMGNMKEKDGFQRAGGEKDGRKRENKPRQTSEGKQKLMKQDVTIDGSLHPSKHGTLAGPVLTPSLSLSFLSASKQKDYKMGLSWFLTITSWFTQW